MTDASPLAEANPQSLDELIGERIADILNKPPLLLSDEDLRRAVGYYRELRARFAKESAEGKTRASTPRAKKVPRTLKEALAQATEDVDLSI